MSPTLGETYKLKNNSMGILERDKNPNEFIKIWKDVSMRLTLEDKDKGGYQFVGSNLGLRFFEKEGKSKKGCIEIEDWGFSVRFVLEFQDNSIYTLNLCFG